MQYRKSELSTPPWLVVIILATILTLIILTPLVSVKAQPNSASFAIGPGFADVTSHQIIRTSDDRVFIFAPQAQYSTVLVGYWTTVGGIPTAATDFNGTATVTDTANIISTAPTYDGSTTIHVLINTLAGEVKDYPFDTTTNSFLAPITIANNGGTVVGDYIGTAGVSGMFDLNGLLHISYWNSTNHIVHQVYLYSAAGNTLAPLGSTTQVDTAGSASHPSLAVSPVDNSVTIAWVSESNAPTGQILSRTRTAAGTWGVVETVSNTDVWTSTSAGINIDQGPALIIGGNNVKYAAFIEDYDSTLDYGRIHFASNNGSWISGPVNVSGTDPQTVINGNSYSHDPGLAINSTGQLYIISHGPMLTGENQNMYTQARNSNGTWAVPALFASGNSFDSSPSIKWSAIGNTRPDTYEFIFFLAPAGNYSATTLYYGRFGDTSTVPPSPPQVSVPPSSGGSSQSSQSTPLITVFDPAISKIGFLQPSQTGVTGEKLEWIVSVTNNGTAAGNNVTIRDRINTSMRVDRVVTPLGTSTVNGQNVTINIPTLDVGQSVQISIFTTVLSGVSIDNTACISADNLSTERCASGLAASALPNTGETPWWRNFVLVSIGLFAGLGVFAWLTIKRSFEKSENGN